MTLTGSADIALGSPFSVIAGGTFNLKAGERQTLTIRLTPTSVGPVDGRVTLNTNGGTFVVLLVLSAGNTERVCKQERADIRPSSPLLPNWEDDRNVWPSP